MKIICVLKFVPDVGNMNYDYKTNTVVRDNVRMILNPDDVCALAFALKLKEAFNAQVSIVTMAPLSIIPLVEDLLRLEVDSATIISDKLYAGSDTYVTSKILSNYLKDVEYDIIFTGTHAIDGDTSHVPSQIAEVLDVNHMNNIVNINKITLENHLAQIEVDNEDSIMTYEIDLPSILSFSKESKIKLPYIKFENMDIDVSHKINMISNQNLNIDEAKLGIEGSLTKVKRTYKKNIKKKEKVVVRNDDEGIETVYKFLKDNRFLKL